MCRDLNGRHWRVGRWMKGLEGRDLDGRDWRVGIWMKGLVGK